MTGLEHSHRNYQRWSVKHRSPEDKATVNLMSNKKIKCLFLGIWICLGTNRQRMVWEWNTAFSSWLIQGNVMFQATQDKTLTRTHTITLITDPAYEHKYAAPLPSDGVCINEDVRGCSRWVRHEKNQRDDRLWRLKAGSIRNTAPAPRLSLALAKCDWIASTRHDVNITWYGW